MKKILILTALFILTMAECFADDSSQNQKNKEYFFGLTSQRTFGAKARHINIGKYFSKYDLIAFEYGTGKYEHLELANKHRQTLDFINAGLYYRRFVPNPLYFLSNSLNIFMGLYRHFWDGDFKYNVCDHDKISYGDCPTSGPNAGHQVKADMKTEATIISVGIGTHWIFENGLTVGVDWGILSRLLYQYNDNFVHETAPGHTARSQIQEDLDDICDEMVRASVTPMTIVVTLGWSF